MTPEDEQAALERHARPSDPRCSYCHAFAAYGYADGDRVCVPHRVAVLGPLGDPAADELAESLFEEWVATWGMAELEAELAAVAEADREAFDAELEDL